MAKDLPVHYKIFVPLIVAGVCIALAFAKTWQGVADLTFNLLFIAYNVRLENAFLAKLGLIGAAAVFLAAYVFWDYSSWFPKDLVFDVSYDERDIAESMRRLPAETLKEIVNKWKARRQSLWEKIDQEIKTVMIRVPSVMTICLLPSTRNMPGKAKSGTETASRRDDIQVARLHRTRGAFVHESHRLRTFHITCIHSLDAETCILYDATDGSIKVATPANTPPQRCEPILPAAHVRIR